MIYDVIIIGAGTAGMTAALNALRNGKTVLVLEKETVGGQISLSPRVENFPTITAISGAELSERLFEQIMHHGADFELEKVTGLKKDGDVFTVLTDYGAHEGKSVIIATGASARHIGVPGEDELIGHGVSYCALCDVLQGRRGRAHRRRQYRFAIRAVFDELLQKSPRLHAFRQILCG